MRMTRVMGLLTLMAVVGAPSAHAGPFNVDPATGAITAGSNSLTFAFVSRSAAFTHWFGLFTTAHTLVPPDYIFKAPTTHAPGATQTVGVTPGTTYLFGLYVLENGMLWFSDGTRTPNVPYQQVKFKFTNIDQYTTRLHMEDLENTWSYQSSCYVHLPSGTYVENCDYDDMVVDVTNTPEPATMGLLALGLVGLAGAGYAKRRRERPRA